MIVPQLFGVCALAATALAIIVAIRQGLRSGLTPTDLAILIPSCVVATIVCAHVFDVAVYQRDRLAESPGLWLRLYQGISLFGALAGIALVTVVVALARRLQLAVVADVAALATLVGLTVGRLGCALVHDHPGRPTDSVFGVEFPASTALWLNLDHAGRDPIVLHDVGLEEFLVLLVLTAVALVLVRRRMNAGKLAALIAIGYAVPRFCLDFLRHPATEPAYGLVARLTMGQWCSIVLLAGGVVGLVHVAAKSRRSALPAATVR